MFDEVGVDRVADRIHRLAGRLADAVPNERLHSPVTPKSGLVTVGVDTPDPTVERLASEGVVVRALPTPNAIRAPAHAVNTPSEVDRLLDALESEWV